ncbi:helix-turn-helix domain-containing protein [Paenibacillus ottowii]|uniref:Helix-turn-helix transcriptional regulator n=1 Tax=Paenibacillus ottowii TaxID=2315729 RepID=A0ABY3BB73_9BACL|nr:helix-turn-helix transcriptional regulator [Paenibacillus ottowii]TQS01398.1 helix-turn-helix transcriptional regulator [Paenibacillus ottowii]TQS01453.1 helix-turn-helix transcriptional regulator [Paenibacillus ottowii]
MSGADSRLKRIRKEKKMSGIAVAKALGITPQYYYDIEKGERRLTTEIAGKLANLYQTTVDYLIGVTDVNQFEIGKNANNPDSHEESELAEIPIERLNQYKLSYKGHDLSKEEADDIIELLEAALKRWKK